MVTYSPSGIVDAEGLFELVDVGLTVDQPAVLADTHDRRLLVLVELVVEIADELFEDVADRDDAGDAAVLVQDEREGPALLSHLAQALQQIQSSRAT